MQLFVALQQPRGRGRLRLVSADPLARPRIEYRYLEESEDRSRMRIGVRTAANLLRTQAFAALFDRFVSINEPILADDARLDAWIQVHLGTAIHLSGSAPMGTVVDGAGRVRGIEGLRVADTSILPTVPSRGPFNTAVFIGELIARQMRDPGATL
jgi:choline dehydrogenase-like flavoprotein